MGYSTQKVGEELVQIGQGEILNYDHSALSIAIHLNFLTTKEEAVINRFLICRPAGSDFDKLACIGEKILQYANTQTKKAYQPLKIATNSISGVGFALQAMRLAKPQKEQEHSTKGNFDLAAKLIKAGDDHAKFARGIIVWYELHCQVGWLLEYEQYEVGVIRLTSSSAMHDELKDLTGDDLAEKKQRDLPEKVYTIADCASYQALRRIYKARKNHRHPDWARFCGWIEELPYFDNLIYPEGRVL